MKIAILMIIDNLLSHGPLGPSTLVLPSGREEKYR